ncbi:MAG: PsbP-related protein [Chitinophagales bacterium]
MALILLFQNAIPLHAKMYPADTLKNDSSAFAFIDAEFDSTDNIVSFKSGHGYSIQYPKEWERDKRAGDNVIFYLRAFDPKFPANFREMLTIIREPIDDISKPLKDYVMMQNTINENTWAKYDINYQVLNMQPFALQTFDAFQTYCTLTEVSQEKLLITFLKDTYAYKIEFTATDVTYKDFLKNVRKVVNSIDFTE